MIAKAIKSLEICSGSHRKWMQADILVPDGRAVTRERPHRLGGREGKREISVKLELFLTLYALHLTYQPKEK